MSTTITTNGDWTVSIDQDRTNRGTARTVTASAFGSDYHDYFSELPAGQGIRKDTRNGSIVLTETTGTGLMPTEEVCIASKKISDIYANYNLDNDSKSKSRTGAQVLAETNLYYDATNSVSGDEVKLPVMLRTVAILPTSICNSDVVADSLKEHVGMLLANESTIATELLNRAKGQLN